MKVDRNFQNHSPIDLKYMINVGRPSYFNDEDFEAWTPFFKYIEESKIPIGVNGVYDDMKQKCEDRQQYGGGGFKFCFFFETKEDRREFLKYLEEELKWNPYRNYEKVSLCQDLDKKLYIRMVSELTEHATKYLGENNITHLNEKGGGGYDVIKVDPSELTWLVKLDKHLNDVILDMD